MHPVKMMMESKLEVHKDKTLREATEMAYKVCCFFFYWHYLLFTVSALKLQSSMSETHLKPLNVRVFLNTPERTL